MKVGDAVLYAGKLAKITATDGVGLGCYEIYTIGASGGYRIIVNTGDLCPIIKVEDTASIGNQSEKETVARPKRYTQGTLEVWDAIQQLGADFRQGSIIKYTMRYKHKNGAEDLKKAMNYLAKMLAEETGEDYYELRKKSLDEL